jgi:hypothetical protein
MSTGIPWLLAILGPICLRSGQRSDRLILSDWNFESYSSALGLSHQVQFGTPAGVELKYTNEGYTQSFYSIQVALTNHKRFILRWLFPHRN